MKKLAIVLWCALLVSFAGKLGWILVGVFFIIFGIVFLVDIIRDSKEIKDWSKNVK